MKIAIRQFSDGDQPNARIGVADSPVNALDVGTA
jgi:hypothetical protein